MSDNSFSSSRQRCDDLLSEFLGNVDRWTKSKSLPEVESNPNVGWVLNLDHEQLRGLGATSCLEHAYELYSYAEYLETLKVKEKNILEWSESSIWFIISKEMGNYGTEFTKWQIKYYSAIAENPLASEILKVKNHAAARVETLDGKSKRVTKMADTLTNLARRKNEF